MISITDSGKKMLEEKFPASDQPLQVRYQPGCGGRAQSRLSLAPGEPKRLDEKFVVHGYTIFIDKDLLALTRGIIISAYPDGRPFLISKNPTI